MTETIPRLPGKRLVLGVSGSIAAYKAVALLRSLMKEGADVHVVMTQTATRFVGPATFEVLSRHTVGLDLFTASPAMPHLALPEQADAVVVAPATANVLAKCALGLADDLLSTLLLNVRGPLVMAPAMDGGMWDHPALQGHVAALRQRGVLVLDPVEGPLASGRIGQGRLVDEGVVVEAIVRLLQPRQDLRGHRVLVSAGPTQEPLDPVRFLSNRSSGKMGYAVAQAARERGASVVLVSGPTSLPPPPGIDLMSVQTTEEMLKAMTAHFPSATLVVMAAAVADFRPKRTSSRKLKKHSHTWDDFALEPTPDILTTLAHHKRRHIMVGFAAETDDILAHANAKLARKNLDLIVANDVSAPGSGFGSDTNQATLIDRDGRIQALDLMPKRDLAEKILDAALALHRSTRRKPAS